ncbi:Rap1GAP [Capsaspora owczarzaki ATCC 30864]|uniref:Rap1GAP n=1 Tax=Capsaspora owczarzaki (strain ATCC 30864) TaxID=595528 RepID=A0A0D2WIW3_CAPO3|nr:Rap1GAP [Capsaspora owczarzaki ATCC 30864]KJE89083.1 Rap1GAP [Capsaspora owczarzaki ATCC 30864]|eukprot:XP_004365504.2 Rap1GAP [Capsaspora owczarzaki ATCC 30864]
MSRHGSVTNMTGTSSASSPGAGGSREWNVPPEQCVVCGNAVYMMERLVMYNETYHQSCFRCCVCSKVMSQVSYGKRDGNSLYCDSHRNSMAARASPVPTRRRNTIHTGTQPDLDAIDAASPSDGGSRPAQLTAHVSRSPSTVRAATADYAARRGIAPSTLMHHSASRSSTGMASATAMRGSTGNLAARSVPFLPSSKSNSQSSGSLADPAAASARSSSTGNVHISDSRPSSTDSVDSVDSPAATEGRADASSHEIARKHGLQPATGSPEDVVGHPAAAAVSTAEDNSEAPTAALDGDSRSQATSGSLPTVSFETGSEEDLTFRATGSMPDLDAIDDEDDDILDSRGFTGSTLNDDDLVVAKPRAEPIIAAPVPQPEPEPEPMTDFSAEIGFDIETGLGVETSLDEPAPSTVETSIDDVEEPHHHHHHHHHHDAHVNTSHLAVEVPVVNVDGSGDADTTPHASPSKKPQDVSDAAVEPTPLVLASHESSDNAQDDSSPTTPTTPTPSGAPRLTVTQSSVDTPDAVAAPSNRDELDELEDDDSFDVDSLASTGMTSSLHAPNRPMSMMSTASAPAFDSESIGSSSGVVTNSERLVSVAEGQQYYRSLAAARHKPSISDTDNIFVKGEVLYRSCHQSGRQIIKDRRYRLRTYPRCFFGSEFIDYLITIKEVWTRDEGVTLAQQLLENKIIAHVVDEHAFKDELLLYQFTADRFHLEMEKTEKQAEKAAKKAATSKSSSASRRATARMPSRDGSAGSPVDGRKLSISSSGSGADGSHGSAGAPDVPDGILMRVASNITSHPMDAARIKAHGAQLHERVSADGLLKDRRARLKVHRTCLMGSKLVDWLVANEEAPSRRDAVALGQQFIDFGVLSHVSLEHDFEDGEQMFHFIADSKEHAALLAASLSAVTASSHSTLPGAGQSEAASMADEDSAGDATSMHSQHSRLSQQPSGTSVPAVPLGGGLLSDMSALLKLPLQSSSSTSHTSQHSAVAAESAPPLSPSSASVAVVAVPEPAPAKASVGADSPVLRTKASSASIPSVTSQQQRLGDRLFGKLVDTNALESLVKDRRLRLRNYPQTLVGSEFVDWMIAAGEASSRTAAVALGVELTTAGDLLYAMDGPAQDFKDDNTFYRFATEVKRLSRRQSDNAQQTSETPDPLPSPVSQNAPSVPLSPVEVSPPAQETSPVAQSEESASVASVAGVAAATSVVVAESAPEAPIREYDPHRPLVTAIDGWVEEARHVIRKEEVGKLAFDIELEHVDDGAHYYRTHFYGRGHWNYYAEDETLGPALLSLRREKDKERNEDIYRVILRTLDLDIRRAVTAEELTSGSGKSGKISPSSIVRQVAPDFKGYKKFHPVLYPDAMDVILRFDEHKIVRHFKFGIVYVKDGQTKEEEMFGNEHGSPVFDDFLTMIGDKVRLKGWTKYKAGLDVKQDQCGTHSVYTTWNHREIMFHVSTLLPYFSNDPQQVQRKRHIGNDIVSIIFVEGETPFVPDCIRSHFLHVFIVIQVENANTHAMRYRVTVISRKDVPGFGPRLIEAYVFQKGPELREFLLAKLINAENAALSSPGFQNLARRTRHGLLKDTIDTFGKFNDASPSVSASVAKKMKSMGVLFEEMQGVFAERKSNRAAGRSVLETGRAAAHVPTGNDSAEMARSAENLSTSPETARRTGSATSSTTTSNSDLAVPSDSKSPSLSPKPRRRSLTGTAASMASMPSAGSGGLSPVSASMSSMPAVSGDFSFPAKDDDKKKKGMLRNIKSVASVLRTASRGKADDVSQAAARARSSRSQTPVGEAASPKSPTSPAPVPSQPNKQGLPSASSEEKVDLLLPREVSFSRLSLEQQMHLLEDAPETSLNDDPEPLDDASAPTTTDEATAAAAADVAATTTTTTATSTTSSSLAPAQVKSGRRLSGTRLDENGVVQPLTINTAPPPSQAERGANRRLQSTNSYAEALSETPAPLAHESTIAESEEDSSEPNSTRSSLTATKSPGYDGEGSSSAPGSARLHSPMKPMQARSAREEASTDLFDMLRELDAMSTGPHPGRGSPSRPSASRSRSDSASSTSEKMSAVLQRTLSKTKERVINSTKMRRGASMDAGPTGSESGSPNSSHTSLPSASGPSSPSIHPEGGTSSDA